MPLHDWTKVGPGIYHMFHGAWLYALARAMNNGLLPAHYYAMTEQRTAKIEADVMTLHAPGPKLPPLPVGNGVHASATEQPAVGVLEREMKSTRRRSGRRLTVRHASSHRVVAIIELISPGNKSGREEYAEFVIKSADLLADGIHLMVVDPFPPPAHAPGGLHASIWGKVARRRKGRKPFTPSPDRPLLAVSYCASSSAVTAAVQPFAVGEAVPEMPLFLTADEEYVSLPLEATYQAAWPDVPTVWRDVLEGNAANSLPREGV
ncbi:MAG TPA: DUF4058 family protein [Fimbriiglobus sp.]|nr:DUF4058 family protein [Fimbriiglobus sp.]